MPYTHKLPPGINLDQAIRHYTDHLGPTNGAASITRLVHIGEPAIPSLINELSGTYLETVENAREALKRIGESAVIPLISVLLGPDTDRRYDVRSHSKRSGAATVLGYIGDQRALLPLINVLEDVNTDAEVRMYVTLAIGKFNDERAIMSLIKYVQDTSKGLSEEENQRLVYIREFAALSLGELNAVKAVKVLINALQEDEEATVRGQAALALGKIGNAEVVSSLLSALHDRSPIVREYAALALADVTDSKVLPALRALQNDPIESIRVAASASICSVEAEDLQELLTSLNSPNKQIQDFAFKVVGRLHPRAISLLAEFAKIGSVSLRQCAIFTLGGFTDERCMAPLINGLVDENMTVRGEAAGALGRQHKWGCRALTEILPSASGKVQRAIEKALVKFDRDALPPLLSLLSERPDQYVSITKILRGMSPDAAEEMLIFYPKGTAIAKEAIVQALRSHWAGAIWPYLERLQDESETIRLTAVRGIYGVYIDALWFMGYHERLIQSCDYDKIEQLREPIRKAREAVQIVNNFAVQSLVTVAQDTDEQVRQNVTTLLEVIKQKHIAIVAVTACADGILSDKRCIEWLRDMDRKQRDVLTFEITNTRKAVTVKAAELFVDL